MKMSYLYPLIIHHFIFLSGFGQILRYNKKFGFKEADMLDYVYHVINNTWWRQHNIFEKLHFQKIKMPKYKLKASSNISNSSYDSLRVRKYSFIIPFVKWIS